VKVKVNVKVKVKVNVNVNVNVNELVPSLVSYERIHQQDWVSMNITMITLLVGPEYWCRHKINAHHCRRLLVKSRSSEIDPVNLD
jgi:hypothetical protein